MNHIPTSHPSPEAKERIKVVSRGGVRFLPLLFLVFFVLKVTGYLNWSWWWITAPLWGMPALFALFIAGIFLVAGIAFLLACADDALRARKRKKRREREERERKERAEARMNRTTRLD